MTMVYFHTFFFATVIIFGALPNATICLTHWKFRSLLKRSSNILICSLALTDFFQSTLALPFALEAASAGHWVAGKIGCTFYAFVCSWFGLSSMLHLAALSAERYYTLSNMKLSDPPKRKIIAFVAFTYVFSFVFSCFPLFGWSEYDFEGNGLHCSVKFISTHPNNLTYTIFLISAFFLPSLFVIVLSSIGVFQEVRRIYRNAREMWGKESPYTKESYRSEIRTAKMTIVVVFAFLAAWLPYVVVIFIKVKHQNVPMYAVEVPALLAKTSLTYNPIVYFFFYKSLRARVIRLISNLWKETTRKTMIASQQRIIQRLIPRSSRHVCTSARLPKHRRKKQLAHKTGTSWKDVKRSRLEVLSTK